MLIFQGAGAGWFILAALLIAIISAGIGAAAGLKASWTTPTTGTTVTVWITTTLGLASTLAFAIFILSQAHPSQMKTVGWAFYLYAIAFIPALIGSIGMSRRKRFSGHMDVSAHAMAQSPSRRIGGTPLLSPMAPSFLFIATFAMTIVGMLSVWLLSRRNMSLTSTLNGMSGISSAIAAILSGDTSGWLALSAFIVAVVCAGVLMTIGIRALVKKQSATAKATIWTFSVLGLLATLGVFALLFFSLSTPHVETIQTGLYLYGFAFIPAIIGAVGISRASDAYAPYGYPPHSLEENPRASAHTTRVLSPVLFVMTFTLTAISVLSDWFLSFVGATGPDMSGLDSVNALSFVLFTIRYGSHPAAWLLLLSMCLALVAAGVLMSNALKRIAEPLSPTSSWATWILVALGAVATVSWLIYFTAISPVDFYAQFLMGFYLYGVAFIPAIIGAVGMSTRKF